MEARDGEDGADTVGDSLDIDVSTLFLSTL